jgi:hypothetical protein
MMILLIEPKEKAKMESIVRRIGIDIKIGSDIDITTKLKSSVRFCEPLMDGNIRR